MTSYSYKGSNKNQKTGFSTSIDRKNPQENFSSKNVSVPQKELLIFFRQLAVILQSGVPLAQGINLLSENTKNPKFCSVLSNISSRLSSGDDLSICLKKYPNLFAPITIGLIEAGEAGGILDKVLDRIATLIEDQEKIKSQINGALIYPVIILVLASSVSLGLLIFIVPKFEQMFKGFGAELPGLTKFMLSLSRLVTSPAFAIGAPLMIFVGVYLYRQYYQTKNGRKLIDQTILNIPLFGPLILISEMASMCDTMATLMNSGIPLVEGLERCMAASNNQIIKDILYLSTLGVAQGQELSLTMSKSKIIPRLVVSMIKIGEETGQLSFMLDNLSIFYKRELETIVSSLTKAMEPMVIIVVAGIVGTIVISLYLPMFKLITTVGS